MIKKDQTDYAAAYRQYCTYGRGRTLKKFCEDEDYNYTKLRRYIDKSFWNASKAERDSIGCHCVPVEVGQADSAPSSALFRYSLADIVREEMCLDPTRLNGVFIFISKKRNIMKILYRGLKRFELTKIRLDEDKFLLPLFDEERIIAGRLTERKFPAF